MAEAVVAYRIGWAQAGTLLEQSYGATLAPGRWHSLQPGAQPRRLIYAASSRALAQLEKRVHANGVTPVGLALFTLTLPARLVVPEAAALGLRADWRDDEGATQAFGNRWLDEGRQLALWVPSYVEPQENNLLINAAHLRLNEITLVKERDPFEFDPRLV